jgi:hypothetical protein
MATEELAEQPLALLEGQRQTLAVAVALPQQLETAALEQSDKLAVAAAVVEPLALEIRLAQAEQAAVAA